MVEFVFLWLMCFLGSHTYHRCFEFVLHSFYFLFCLPLSSTERNMTFIKKSEFTIHWLNAILWNKTVFEIRRNRRSQSYLNGWGFKCINTYFKREIWMMSFSLRNEPESGRNFFGNIYTGFFLFTSALIFEIWSEFFVNTHFSRTDTFALGHSFSFWMNEKHTTSRIIGKCNRTQPSDEMYTTDIFMSFFFSSKIK